MRQERAYATSGRIPVTGAYGSTVGLIALLWLRRPYGEIAGLLAGAMTDPPALAFAQATSTSDGPARIYSTVYPLTMLLRIAASQTLMLVWF